MDRTELAWAAGFWDGEGSAYLTGSSDRATRQPQARINQSSTTGVPTVLSRFHAAVGLGSISGPELKHGREPLYRWVISRRSEIEEVATVLCPWLGGVKREQLRAVVGDPGIRALRWDDVPEDEGRAWCAGLWDGEGCISILDHRTHPGRSILEASITQSSDSGIPEVLERFRAVVGNVGNIYGPYDAGPDRQPVYRWKLWPLELIRQVVMQLDPQIGPVKRSQAHIRLAVVLAQPPLPRGNPAWGSHKTHCVRGHEYAAARVRPFRGRGKNIEAPRASHQCLRCVREDARTRKLARETKSGG